MENEKKLDEPKKVKIEETEVGRFKRLLLGLSSDVVLTEILGYGYLAISVRDREIDSVAGYICFCGKRYELEDVKSCVRGYWGSDPNRRIHQLWNDVRLLGTYGREMSINLTITKSTVSLFSVRKLQASEFSERLTHFEEEGSKWSVDAACNVLFIFVPNEFRVWNLKKLSLCTLSVSMGIWVLFKEGIDRIMPYLEEFHVAFSSLPPPPNEDSDTDEASDDDTPHTLKCPIQRIPRGVKNLTIFVKGGGQEMTYSSLAPILKNVDKSLEKLTFGRVNFNIVPNALRKLEKLKLLYIFDCKYYAKTFSNLPKNLEIVRLSENNVPVPERPERIPLAVGSISGLPSMELLRNNRQLDPLVFKDLQTLTVIHSYGFRRPILPESLVSLKVLNCCYFEPVPFFKRNACPNVRNLEVRCPLLFFAESLNLSSSEAPADWPVIEKMTNEFRNLKLVVRALLKEKIHSHQVGNFITPCKYVISLFGKVVVKVRISKSGFYVRVRKNWSKHTEGGRTQIMFMEVSELHSLMNRPSKKKKSNNQRQRSFDFLVLVGKFSTL